MTKCGTTKSADICEWKMPAEQRKVVETNTNWFQCGEIRCCVQKCEKCLKNVEIIVFVQKKSETFVPTPGIEPGPPA